VQKARTAAFYSSANAARTADARPDSDHMSIAQRLMASS
jgi:hypothetical protein